MKERVLYIRYINRKLLWNSESIKKIQYKTGIKIIHFVLYFTFN